MRLPSVKTLSRIAGKRAKELREILECGDFERLDALCEKRYPATNGWVQSCFNRPTLNDIKMSIADDILDTCGVEGIPEGHNTKSPSIEYCNTGESYDATLLLIDGRRFAVGSWADIVERGNYD